MGQLTPNLESPDACEPKTNKSGDTFTVRWLQAHANANEDKIKAADKPIIPSFTPLLGISSWI